MTLIFDIETDGLLDTLTTIHSLVIFDTEKNLLFSWCSKVKGLLGEEIAEDGVPLTYYSIETGLSMLDRKSVV